MTKSMSHYSAPIYRVVWYSVGETVVGIQGPYASEQAAEGAASGKTRSSGGLKTRYRIQKCESPLWEDVEIE